MTAPTLLQSLLRPMVDPDFDAIPQELAARSFDRKTPYQQRLLIQQVSAAQLSVWRIGMTLNALFETYPYIQVIDLEWMVKGRLDDPKVSLYSRINPADPSGPKNFAIDDDVPPDWAMTKDQAKVFRQAFYEWGDVYDLSMGQAGLKYINLAYKVPVTSQKVNAILEQHCPLVLEAINRIILKQETPEVLSEQDLFIHRL